MSMKVAGRGGMHRFARSLRLSMPGGLMVRISVVKDKLYQKLTSQGIPEEILDFVLEDASFFPKPYRKLVAIDLARLLEEANQTGRVSFDDLKKQLGDQIILVRNWLRFAKQPDGSDLNMHATPNWPSKVAAAQRWERGMLDEFKEKGHPSLYKHDDPEHTFLKFDDGWRWVTIPSDDCYNEGKSMQHCVWGNDYISGTANGTKVLYSLRDPQGQPHVTVEAKTDEYSDAYREALDSSYKRKRLAPWVLKKRPGVFTVLKEYGDEVIASDLGAPQAEMILKEKFRELLGDEKRAEAIAARMMRSAEEATSGYGAKVRADELMSGDVLEDRTISQVYGKQNQPPIAKYSPYIRQLFRSLPEKTQIPAHQMNKYLDPDEVLEAFEKGNITLEDASRRLRGTPQFERIAELMRPMAVNRFMQGNADYFMDIVEAEGWDSPVVEDTLNAIGASQGRNQLPLGGFREAPLEVMDRLAVVFAPRSIRAIMEGGNWDRDVAIFKHKYGSSRNPFSNAIYEAISRMFAEGNIDVSGVYSVLNAIEALGEMGKRVLMLNPQKVAEFVNDKDDPFQDRRVMSIVSAIVGNDPEFMGAIQTSLIDEFRRKIQEGELSPSQAASEMLSDSIPPALILDAVGPKAYEMFRGWFGKGGWNPLVSPNNSEDRREQKETGGFRKAINESPVLLETLRQAALDASREGDAPLYEIYGKLSVYGFPGEFKALTVLQNEETLAKEMERGLLSLKGLEAEIAGSEDPEPLMEAFLRVKNRIIDDVASGEVDLSKIDWMFESGDLAEIGRRRSIFLSELAREDPEKLTDAMRDVKGSWVNEVACKETLEHPERPEAADFVRMSLGDPVAAFNLMWTLQNQTEPGTTLYDFLPADEVTRLILNGLSSEPDRVLSSTSNHQLYSGLLSQLPPSLIRSPELRPLLKKLMARYPSSDDMSDLISRTAIGENVDPADMASMINSMFSKMRTKNPRSEQIEMLMVSMIDLAKKDPDRFYAIIPLLDPNARNFLRDKWGGAMEKTRVLPSEVGYINPPNDPEAEQRFVQNIERRFEEVPTERDLTRKKLTSPKQYTLLEAAIGMLEGVGMYRQADRLDRMLLLD